MFLLDASILIAMGDGNHIFHARATRWFFAQKALVWATCPLVQNAFIRVIGAPNYPDFPGGTNEAKAVLQQICRRPGHQFWPDSVTLCDYPELPAARHLTDFYLLALAIRHQARFATLDRRIDPSRIAGGEKAYCVIP